MPMSEAASFVRPVPALGQAAAAARLAVLPARLDGVAFDAGGESLVRDLSLTLDAGPMSVVMGPNGSGKTLMLRLLHGLVVPTRGRVTWAGAPLTDAVRRRQAMVFQKPVLLRRSVAANVDFVLSLTGRSDPAVRDALLDRVGLLALSARPARRLSGGEQQRLALARALATEPDVLFLDEPTASLDPASTLRIEEVVRWAHAHGTKIVWITHDIGQARRLADEVVFLHRGRVVEQAPADAFFAAPQTQAARDFLAGRIVL